MEKVGAPKYAVDAYPGTPAYILGARNCQTWVDQVLDVARGGDVGVHSSAVLVGLGVDNWRQEGFCDRKPSI